jgi:hypothetical protein
VRIGTRGWDGFICVMGQAVSRARTPPGRGYRFLGFAPHEQDYEPSADQFANMNSAVRPYTSNPLSQPCIIWLVPGISIGSIFLAVPGELDASAAC